MMKNRIRADYDINEPINEEACGRLMIELFGDNASAMGEVLLHRAADAFCHDSTITPEIQGGFEAFANRMSRAEVELTETIHPNESLSALSARTMGKLFTANDAHAARAPRRTGTFDLGSRLSEFLSSLTPRTLSWSATAAAVVILMQAAVITAVVVKEQVAPSEESRATFEPNAVPGNVQSPLDPAATAVSAGLPLPPPTLSDEEIAALVAGGRQLMAADDIPNARLVLQQAAEAGNATAALELGATYDPFVLQQLADRQRPYLVESSPEAERIIRDREKKVVGEASVERARWWYEKAKDLGSTEAAVRLERLRSVPNPRR
jgi:hypothetical protein